MNVQVAVVCDCANVAQGEKLNVMGVFDTLHCPRFPATHPMLALVLRFECDFADAEKRQHEITIELKDEDLRQHARASANIAMNAIPAGRTGCLNQILNFAGMTFRRPGTYNFHVSWDGKEVARVPLYVVEQAQRAGA